MTKRNKPSPKLQYAIDWLLEFMGDYRIPATSCICHAARAGIKPRTLQRAKDNTDIVCLWAGSHWVWVRCGADEVYWPGPYMAVGPERQIN